MSCHYHHDMLFEYCHDYQERVNYIKRYKPKNEQKIRLKRFFMLTKEQVKMFPVEFVEARQKYDESRQKYDEARQKLVESKQKLVESRQKHDEAWQKYKPQLEKIHRKICSCKEWNGKALVFK